MYVVIIAQHMRQEDTNWMAFSPCKEYGSPKESLGHDQTPPCTLHALDLAMNAVFPPGHYLVSFMIVYITYVTPPLKQDYGLYEITHHLISTLN